MDLYLCGLWVKIRFETVITRTIRYILILASVFSGFFSR